MITLMTYAGPGEETSPVGRTGGLPLNSGDFSWPTCATCKGPMQFLAQLPLDDLGRYADRGEVGGRGMLAVFMCQNDPGMCEEWDPTAGGNAAYVFPAEELPSPVSAPEGGETKLGEVSVFGYERVDSDDYYEASTGWAKRTGRPQREALGQLGGEPSWLQGEETPDCPSCGRLMDLAMQLEEGRHHETSANFGGGGCGYAFVCEDCAKAAFLWQS
ncbi:DUF1963 domain-containing protein [Streptomyces alkaliterrae]|nr:DUF1963 domain-containing protein [Streptomyces alkaliterrae]